ncbi:hypothetical protein ABZW11_17095 [Nonomuraea sp. NPDC004580]|uniref:hypothetical protein n=1 Tax=Nonomuraea sp. NPDC004580 TaxID=3154552 RepID=UPI0033BC09EA
MSPTPDQRGDFAPSEIPADVVIQDALAPYFGGFEQAEPAAKAVYAALTVTYRRAVVDAEQLAGDEDELRQLRAEVAWLRAGEASEPPAPHVTLTPAEWLWKLHDATPEKRLHVIEVLLGEVDRGSRCFRMNHEGVIEDLRAELARAQRNRRPEIDGEPRMHPALSQDTRDAP